MLRELRIENLLLIERAELRFGPGLNAITGETGAGKTMLAHSVDLLLGGKPNPSIVMPGAGEIWIEAEFDAPAGFWDDPELADQSERFADAAADGIVLARRVPAEGRSRAFVCHRSATTADLAAIGSRLLSFFGQFEHRRLALSRVQAEVLDRFAGGAHLELLAGYQAAHAEVLAHERRLAEIDAAEASRERDADLLRFELEEIRAVAPEVEERDSLAVERDRLRNATALTEAVAEAWTEIGSEDDGTGAADRLRRSAERVSGAAHLDATLNALSARLVEITEGASEIASELRTYLEGISSQADDAERVEERLDAIERLERKHGGTTETVLAYAEECERRLAAMERAEEDRAEVTALLGRAQTERASVAEALSASRKTAAKKLEKAMSSELRGLALEGAALAAALEPEADGYGPNGAEKVELRFGANPGIDPAPLREAASGGELSRVMLALATLSGAGESRAIVFDEIDSGVGGRVAARVGERLAALAGERQVICITHLAQVASRSDRHFTVEKVLSGGEARTTVSSIEGEQLVGELVRMLGADAGDQAATQHARELLAA